MRIARIYDPPEPDDGVRVLADRLWPRGVRKDDPRIDGWIKDVAPSSELRRWYNHDLDRQLAETGTVTLLTSAKDVEHGHLVVLRRLLEKRS